jgi:mRNA interferase MazF
MPGYVPQRGDVIWITLNPQAGHEQAGRRPAVVLSPAAYNGKVGLAILCPITSQVKGYPFEVGIPDGLPVRGVILSDQVKSLDWRARNAERMCTLPPDVVAESLAKLNVLLAQ